jgi:hypothetical protein
MRAGPGHLRIIVKNVAEAFGAHEIRHHDVVVRLALERRGAERRNIEVGHDLSDRAAPADRPRAMAIK